MRQLRRLPRSRESPWFGVDLRPQVRAEGAARRALEREHQQGREGAGAHPRRRGRLRLHHLQPGQGKKRRLRTAKPRRTWLQLDEVNSLLDATEGRTKALIANVRSRLLAGAIKAANKKRFAAGAPPIQAGITNHSLRRTFASRLYEAGASPAYVMQQMGHTSSSLALEVYPKVMQLHERRETGARVDALIRAAAS